MTGTSLSDESDRVSDPAVVGRSVGAVGGGATQSDYGQRSRTTTTGQTNTIRGGGAGAVTYAYDLGGLGLRLEARGDCELVIGPALGG